MQQRVVVVVNGADSFLGRRVCEALQQSGWADTIAVETGDSARLASALNGAHAVANCILGRPKVVLSSASALTGNGSLPVSLRIVHLSSMTVYGSTVGEVDEHSATPADLGEYSAAQLAAESRVAQHPNATVLRLGVEFGPDCPAWTNRIARLLIAGRLGDLGSGGDGTCNLIFIDDLVAIILRALREPDLGGQIFNVAQSIKPTWNEYFSQFAIAMGAVPVRRISARRLQVESKLLSVPLKLAEIGAGFAGLGDAGIWPPITPALLQTCRQEIRLSGLKAEQAFSVRWTPLEKSLQLSASAWRR